MLRFESVHPWYLDLVCRPQTPGLVVWLVCGWTRESLGDQGSGRVHIDRPSRSLGARSTEAHPDPEAGGERVCQTQSVVKLKVVLLYLRSQAQASATTPVHARIARVRRARRRVSHECGERAGESCSSIVDVPCGALQLVKACSGQNVENKPLACTPA